MAVLQTVGKAAVQRMPKIVSPRTHAILDYVSVGMFLIGAMRWWHRNRRAAVASAIAGAGNLAMNLLTDYPGGVRKTISFPVHCEIDTGVGALVGTLPKSLSFEDSRERKMFVLQGAAITAAAQLTDREPERPTSNRLRTLCRAA